MSNGVSASSEVKALAVLIFTMLFTYLHMYREGFTLDRASFLVDTVFRLLLSACLVNSGFNLYFYSQF